MPFSLLDFIACPTNATLSYKMFLLWINVGVTISLLLNLILFNTLSFFPIVLLKERRQETTFNMCGFVRCTFSYKSSREVLILSIWCTRKANPSVEWGFKPLSVPQVQIPSTIPRAGKLFLLFHKVLLGWHTHMHWLTYCLWMLLCQNGKTEWL